MTRAILVRRRRHLQAQIPIEKKTELKYAIYQLGRNCGIDLQLIRQNRQAERNKLETRYNDQMTNVRRKFERDRTELIEKYEREFGSDVIKEVLR